MTFTLFGDSARVYVDAPSCTGEYEETLRLYERAGRRRAVVVVGIKTRTRDENGTIPPPRVVLGILAFYPVELELTPTQASQVADKLASEREVEYVDLGLIASDSHYEESVALTTAQRVLIAEELAYLAGPAVGR